MEDNKTYFGEIGHGLKTLAVGMKTSWKEYFKDFFTNKSTEQYPENRKTTLHVAKRHRGRLVFKRNDDGTYKCTACTLCEKACPNGTIKITAHMAEDPETGKKKKVLDDYAYDLGDCMFCQLCTNACNFDAIEFTNDFENAVFDRSKLVLHLDKEVYQGGSLPNLIEGGAEWQVGKFNTKNEVTRYGKYNNVYHSRGDHPRLCAVVCDHHANHASRNIHVVRALWCGRHLFPA